MILAVSACLLGRACKYSGGSNRNEAVIRIAGRPDVTVVEVCPEVTAGLPVPRPPVELREGRIVRQDGVNMDEVYRRGAAVTFATVQKAGVQMAILKANSPTCGHGQVYDGTFSHTLTEGNGVFAEMLINGGIPVYSEREQEQICLQLS